MRSSWPVAGASFKKRTIVVNSRAESFFRVSFHFWSPHIIGWQWSESEDGVNKNYVFASFEIYVRMSGFEICEYQNMGA